MDQAYVTPTNTTQLKSWLLQAYLYCTDAATDLRQWMLQPPGYRRGSVNLHFTPFFQHFSYLFTITKNLAAMTQYNDVMSRISVWHEKCAGVFGMTPAEQDRRFTIGLDLFDLWSKGLIQQGVVEFA